MQTYVLRNRKTKEVWAGEAWSLEAAKKYIAFCRGDTPDLWEDTSDLEYEEYMEIIHELQAF
jgi:hypothetical protein